LVKERRSKEETTGTAGRRYSTKKKNYKVERKSDMNKRGEALGIGAAVLVLLGLIIFAMTFGWVNVHPTEVAVEVNKAVGKVIETPKGVGYHFYNHWITDMVVYKVAARAFPSETIEQGDAKKYTLELKTNDGQNVNVDLTIIYALKANEVPKLHQDVGPNYEDQVLLPQIRSEARLAIGGYSAEEIYQGKVREEIQSRIKDKLSASVSSYPAIQIHDALIRHFQFSPDFEKAIEQKKLAAQNVEINKNKALAQEQEAFRVEAEARGNKLKAVQEAEGRAQAVKIEADASRYKLEQEAIGKLAGYKADAEGKRLQAEALGGGKNVVALKFAEMLPPTLKIIGVPVGQNTTSIMDLNGVFKGMFANLEETPSK
jgi:regulator of protease activity HflC (stomatin/prohibitin superfamily)